MKRTPIQEAYNRLDKLSDKYLKQYKEDYSQHTDGIAVGIDESMRIVKSMLEKEKIDMCAFVNDVLDEYVATRMDDVCQQYDKTFNTKE